MWMWKLCLSRPGKTSCALVACVNHSPPKTFLNLTSQHSRDGGKAAAAKKQTNKQNTFVCSPAKTFLTLTGRHPRAGEPAAAAD